MAIVCCENKESLTSKANTVLRGPPQLSKVIALLFSPSAMGMITCFFFFYLKKKPKRLEFHKIRFDFSAFERNVCVRIQILKGQADI